jgi:hypothetical protein
MDLGPALFAAGLRLNFPPLAIGTDVYVATAELTVVAIPPVALNSHLLTV